MECPDARISCRNYVAKMLGSHSGRGKTWNFRAVPPDSLLCPLCSHILCDVDYLRYYEFYYEFYCTGILSHWHISSCLSWFSMNPWVWESQPSPYQCPVAVATRCRSSQRMAVVKRLAEVAMCFSQRATVGKKSCWKCQLSENWVKISWKPST